MGLFKKNKLDIVPKEKDLNSLVTNYTNCINMNGKLVVPDGYEFLLGKKGKVLDRFTSGEHFFNFNTLPYVCRKYKIDKVPAEQRKDKLYFDGYYIDTRLKAGKFASAGKAKMGTKTYGFFTAQVYVVYSYKVVNPKELLQSLLNFYDIIYTGEAEDIIENWLSEKATYVLEKNNFILNDVIKNEPIIADTLKIAMSKVLKPAGIEIVDFKIYKYKLPKEYQKSSDNFIKIQQGQNSQNSDKNLTDNQSNVENQTAQNINTNVDNSTQNVDNSVLYTNKDDNYSQQNQTDNLNNIQQNQVIDLQKEYNKNNNIYNFNNVYVDNSQSYLRPLSEIFTDNNSNNTKHIDDKVLSSDVNSNDYNNISVQDKNSQTNDNSNFEYNSINLNDNTNLKNITNDVDNNNLNKYEFNNTNLSKDKQENLSTNITDDYLQNDQNVNDDFEQLKQIINSKFNCDLQNDYKLQENKDGEQLVNNTQNQEYVPFGNFVIEQQVNNNQNLNINNFNQSTKNSKSYVDLSLDSLYNDNEKGLKICPVCKTKNYKTASRCKLCGEILQK